MDEIGAFYDLMPPKGLKWNFLTPSDRTKKSLNLLIGYPASNPAVYGLGRISMHFKSAPELHRFSAVRSASAGHQSKEMQKNLERYICDWAGRNALRWGAQTRCGFTRGLGARECRGSGRPMREGNELTGEKGARSQA